MRFRQRPDALLQFLEQRDGLGERAPRGVVAAACLQVVVDREERGDVAAAQRDDFVRVLALGRATRPGRRSARKTLIETISRRMPGYRWPSTALECLPRAVERRA
jgi:hypothetical protein